MKSTGIVRRMDNLGRVVIPKELCRTLHIKKGSPVEIFVSGDMIVLRKYGRYCACCDNSETGALREVKGVSLCEECIKKFKEVCGG